jgi:Domain of unknown function (DUF4091)
VPSQSLFCSALILLWGGFTLFAQNNFQVWATGDSVRINPVTGRAWETNRMIFPDALAGDYKRSNIVWNGKSGDISLRAAHNEIISFQVVVERLGDTPLKHVNVTIGNLVGPGGATIPAANVDLFKEWYVRVDRRSSQNYSLGTGWYPDALIPCTHWTGKLFPRSSILPFSVPDQLNNIGPEQKNQAFWADIYVPRDREKFPSGVYRSQVVVSSPSGNATLNLKLSVWNFALPDKNHLGGDIHTDTELHTFAPELELKYYQLIRKHRLVMGEIGYVPDIHIEGKKVQVDWTSYDNRLSKYLDGSAFTEKYGYNGPGYGLPIELLMLPFDAYPTNDYYNSRHVGWPYGKEWKFYRPWPVELPDTGITPEYTAIWKNTFQAFQKHIEEHPEWDRTKFIVFLLSLDESYDKDSVEKILYYGNLIKEAGATRLKYRVDGSYPMDTMDRLAKVVDIAILGVRSYVPDRVKQLREHGVADWFYTGMGNTDGDPLGCRALGWVSWKYGAQSWAIWEMDFNSLRAWMYADTYTEHETGNVQNGQGFLVYRGETMGLEEPVASIRLKLMRRGSQDYEYFWLLSQRLGGKQRADSLVSSIIHEPLGTSESWGSPGMWRHNAEEWERIRMQMGEWIDSQTK